MRIFFGVFGSGSPSNGLFFFCPLPFPLSWRIMEKNN